MHDAADAPRDTHHQRIDEPTGLTRRALTRSAAWSVPAIAVAATVPAVAASAELPTVELEVELYCYGKDLQYDVSALQPIPAGAQLAISVTSSVPGSLAGQIHALPYDPTVTPAIVTGGGVTYSTRVEVWVTLPSDTDALITLTITALSGLRLTGTTSINSRTRTDASGAYECVEPSLST